MIGSTILHYEIVELLGRGAMGSAYKARDTRLDTFRTLKFLHADLNRDPAARENLVREARIQARLLHPNICALMALEVTEERSFLVLQYVEGQSLDRYMEFEKPGTLERFRLILQVAEALAAAHEAGVIHRDIKPENVLVDRDGTVRVTDFGLSRALGATAHSASLETKGTAAYMPPESFQGQRVDQRGDVWSLGVLAQEVLTGELPFRGDTFESLAYQILHAEPQPLESSLAGAIPGIEEFIHRCLSKDPGERFADSGEAHAALERIAWASGHGDVVPKPVLEFYRRRMRRKVLRRGLQVGAAVVVALAALAVARLLRPADAPLVYVWSSSASGGISSISWDPGGRYIAYLSRGSYAGILIRDAVDREAPIERVEFEASGDLRNIRWSPDGEKFAIASYDGTFLFYPDADSVLVLTDRVFDSIEWSSDGRYLVYCDRERLIDGRSDLGIIGPMDTGAEGPPAVRSLDLSGAPTGHCYNPVFVLGDSRIAFIVDDSGVHRGLWSVPSGGGTVVRACDPDRRDLEELRAWTLRWVDERNELLFDRLDAAGLYRIRLDADGRMTGEVESLGIRHQVSDFEYCPGTHLLAATSNAWNFMVLSLPLESDGGIAPGTDATTVFETIGRDDTEQILSPALEPDGVSLVLSALTPNGLELQRLDIDSGGMSDLIPGAGEISREWQPSVDPSGSSRIAFVADIDGRPHLLVFDGTYHVLSTDEETVRRPTWSADGSSIYYTRSVGSGLEGRDEIVRMRLDPYRREPVVAGVDVLLDDAEDRSLLFGSALPDASAEYVLYDDERDADGSGGAAISTISELGILRVSTGEHRVICRGSSPALDPSRRNAYFLREESLQLLRDWTSCLEGSCEPRLLPLPAGEWGLSTLLGTPMTIGERFIYLVAQDHMEGDLMLYRLRK